MDERLRKLRKVLDLTQQEFADKIGSKRNTVATYEMGRTTPSAAVISLICKTFNVSEEWLRTGEGGDTAMFVQRSREDELTATVERLLTGESADFKRRLITVLSSLKEEHWIVLEEKLKEIVGMRDAAPASTSEHIPTIEEEARAEAEEYYLQVLMEKKRRAESSVSQSDTSASEKDA